MRTRPADAPRQPPQGSLGDREKRRLVPLKPLLFDAEAIAADGMYKKKPRDFCLVEQHAAANLWRGVREEALAYFAERGLGWHDGHAGGLPSNHLCCSQSSCVNALMAFRTEPEALGKALKTLGIPVRRVLPIEEDRPGRDGTRARSGALGAAPAYLAFEWIGTRNYLGEGSGGRAAADEGRSRGKHFTSADFFIRYEHEDGSVGLLLGEWKYTEKYGAKSIRFSKKSKKTGKSTDRLPTYAPFLNDHASPIVRPAKVLPQDLMYEPFDQLMRLQLLAWRMEGHELGATHATVVHVAPDENTELASHITSPELAKHVGGKSVHEVWSKLVPGPRFCPLSTRRLLEALVAVAPDRAWAEYMQLRYLGMA